MAIDANHSPTGAPLALGARVSAALGRWLAASRVTMQKAMAAAGASAVVRFFTSSLVRRILFSNLVGLLMLLVGILYLSQQNAWLIRAKLDSLRTQGEIIAAALASRAMVDADRLAFPPGQIPEVERPRAPYRDDGFAKLELSLRPDRVAPVLRLLIQPTNTRARVYGLDGTLISDSSTLIGRAGSMSRGAGETEDGKRVRLRTNWTRVMAWLTRAELPVYKEIGSANGTAYPEVRAALQGASTAMLLLTDDFEQIVSIAVPVQRKNTTLGVVLLSTRPGEIDETLAAERSAVLAVAAMAIVVTLLTSFLLWRTIAVPTKQLASAARQVSESINARAELPDFSSRQDEVGRMATAFREMTQALYDRIEQSERFAADVAHELKNPLAAANGIAQSLALARTDADRDELVGLMRDELKRLNRMISDVSNASRLDAELARQQTEPVDLRVVLSRVVGIFSDLRSEDGIRIVLDVPEVPLLSDAYVVRGHEGRLGQVATNLIDNACSFSREGDVVTVRLRPLGNDVEFTVDDQGPGIPDDKLEKVFERFYSDRPLTDQTRGRNSGLGLSISRNIVKAHGGRIWAENIGPEGLATRETGAKPAGARFTVRLPALRLTTAATRRA